MQNLTNADLATLTLLLADAEIIGAVVKGDWTVDSLVIAAAMAHEAGQMTELERDRLVRLALTAEGR